MTALPGIDLGTNLLNELEFTPTLPCEYEEHAKMHRPDGPGEWLVVAFCPACGAGGKAVICNAGKEQKMLPGVMVECKGGCGHIDAWSAFVRSLERFV